jgi:pyridoxine 4-dehydrogenase
MKTINLIDQEVPRIGYGTMRLPGKGVMGPPDNHDEAIKVLKRTIELGIKVIDTAWYYGPYVANELLAEALYPYPDDLIIITKLGGKRDEAGNWLSAIKPDELRQGMENDLRLLKLDSVPIVHLRWIDETSPEMFEEALDTMIAMQQEGKLQHIGLSNVTDAQLTLALSKAKIATISNSYNIDDRQDDLMIDRCAKEGIAYLPFFPLSVGKSASQPVIQKWANELGFSPIQIALAWLLKRSDSILPIPGTSSVAHLEENYAAASIELPDEAYSEIEQSAK